MTADAADSGPSAIPAVRIADAPRFAWRGLMLDSARHYQPPGSSSSFIDWMALHKLNVLHWHLTDDQGWRLEIRKYPRLTQVGAWRVPAGAAGRADSTRDRQAAVYGGYYTPGEVRGIVAYAAERFVTIVPEIEMPGHAQAAIASYPRARHRRVRRRRSRRTGACMTISSIADETTLAFLEDVLAEVIELFPGEYIHVGGDEAVKNRWKNSPRVQARIRELGLADETALQGWFVARIGRFLDSSRPAADRLGRDPGERNPARASIMSWRGTEGAIAAARAGHDVVMAPAPTLYLDHLQSDSPREPPGRPAVVTLEDIYAYEPVPPGLAPRRHATSSARSSMPGPSTCGCPSASSTRPSRAPRRSPKSTWSPASARDWHGFPGAARGAVRPLPHARNPLRRYGVRAACAAGAGTGIR